MGQGWMTFWARNQGQHKGYLEKWAQRGSGARTNAGSLKRNVTNKGRTLVFPYLVIVKTHKAKRRSCLTVRVMGK